MKSLRLVIILFAAAVLPAFAFANDPVNDSVVNPGNKVAADEDKSRFDRLTDQVLKQMDGDRSGDPLKYITGDMTGIVKDLEEYKTDRPVQVKQDKVVARLEELIKELEKQCSGGGGGGANPTKPLARSVIAGGPGGQGEMIDPRQGDKQWATLPPKQREQILQSRTEGFPPGYEAILQSYYRRLSQEQVTPDGADSPGPAPSPAPSPSPGVAPAPAPAPAPTTKPAAP